MEQFINKVIQSDCVEFLRQLPSESVECCIIDEPYNVLTNHKIEQGYNLDIALEVRREIYRILKKDGWFVWFGQFPSAYDYYTKTLEANFEPWKQCNEIVWCKRTVSSPFPPLLRIHENIFVFKKGNPIYYDNKAPYEDIIVPQAFNGISSEENLQRYFAALKQQIKAGTTKVGVLLVSGPRNDPMYSSYGNSTYQYQSEMKLPSIWSFAKENRVHINSHNIKHPTVKPVLLLRRLVKLFTKTGDVVLDCFSGSGTTALATIQEGRQFIGCEKDSEYVEIANNRLATWKEDLERQDQWLKQRGVQDFDSDIAQDSDMQPKLF